MEHGNQIISFLFFLFFVLRKESNTATVKEILSKDQLLAMEDFAIEETDKILARMKYLTEKFGTLDKSDTKAQLDAVVESQRLSGKLDGIHLVMEELERLAENTYCIMRN